MQLEVKLFLLKVGKYNGNILPLIDMGFEYSQVIKFLDVLIEEKKLIRQDSKIKITEQGLLEMNELNKKFNRLNSSQWIEPAIENKISIFDVNDIFLPDQNELSF